MDAELKFTEDIDYIIQEEFEDNIQDFPFAVIADIIKQIDENFKNLPQKDFIVQSVCGISKAIKGEQYFFLIQYMKSKKETNILLDIEDVHSDTFLDYINLNKTFAYENGDSKTHK